MIEVHGDDRFI